MLILNGNQVHSNLNHHFPNRHSHLCNKTNFIISLPAILSIVQEIGLLSQGFIFLVNTLFFCLTNICKMKTPGPTHRKEETNINVLYAKVDIAQLFRDVGCYNFYGKLQGYHHQVVEAFTKSFDGTKAQVVLMQLQVDI